MEFWQQIISNPVGAVVFFGFYVKDWVINIGSAISADLSAWGWILCVAIELFIFGLIASLISLMLFGIVKIVRLIKSLISEFKK